MIWLSKLTERPVYCRDEARKLTDLHRMVPYIIADYFRREVWIGGLLRCPRYVHI